MSSSGEGAGVPRTTRGTTRAAPTPATATADAPHPFASKTHAVPTGRFLSCARTTRPGPHPRPFSSALPPAPSLTTPQAMCSKPLAHHPPPPLARACGVQAPSTTRASMYDHDRTKDRVADKKAARSGPGSATRRSWHCSERGRGSTAGELTAKREMRGPCVAAVAWLRPFCGVEMLSMANKTQTRHRRASSKRPPRPKPEGQGGNPPFCDPVV